MEEELFMREICRLRRFLEIISQGREMMLLKNYNKNETLINAHLL